MTYIAQTRLLVGAGYREFGDPIPEAEEWPWWVRVAYEREGRIKEVADVSTPDPVRVKGPSKNG